MSNFERLVDAQTELGTRIMRTMTNVNKTPEDRRTIAFYERSLKMLEGRWESYEQNHQTLASRDEFSKSSYKANDQQQAVESSFLEASVEIAERIQDMRQATRAPNLMDASLNVSTADVAASVMQQIQLPIIDPPTFSGDILKWRDFEDLFQDMVGSVNGLSDAKKLLYLKRSLTG